MKRDYSRSQISIDNLAHDLERLASAPGPTQAVAKISQSDPRLSEGRDFPITAVVKKVVNEINQAEDTDLTVFQHHGNLCVVGGVGNAPSQKDIYDIPLTMAAHLDEITYLVSKRSHEGYTLLFPLCNAPKRILHSDARIFGYRGPDADREFVEIGEGCIDIDVVRAPKAREKKETYFYCLDTKASIRDGDMVIQDYGPDWVGQKGASHSIMGAKALDDRVGVTTTIHAVKELCKVGVAAKAILSGSEEGIGQDVAWARLARETFRSYCRKDGVVIICDGIDGVRLEEFERQKGSHLEEALVVPYTSFGKGGGDPGLYSLLRDIIVPTTQSWGFKVSTTTDYVSRSIDPKLMDEYPLMGFVDWSNGKVLHRDSVCHQDESVMMEQLVNIIGTLVCTGLFAKRAFN